MSLFEYLAYPYDFKKFEKVKKEIACHVAKSRQQYEKISSRFLELTGEKDEKGSYTGYRTRIVHLGEGLEQLLDDQQIKNLFIELSQYLGTVIQDMINYAHYSWDEFINYRDILKNSLGVKHI
jgi:hypothetical protein